jgi:hypothetical protein
MKAIMVEEILTDDSMKGIDYLEINSDFSDELSNTANGHGDKGCKKKKK